MVNTAFNVALRAVALGAEHIPDKVFEALPGGYFKAKEKRERKAKEHRRARRSSRRDSHHTDDEYASDYYTSGDEDRRRESRRAERREQERRRRARSVGGERTGGEDGWDPERDFGRSKRASLPYPYDYRLPPHAYYPPPQGYPPQAYPAQPYSPQVYPPPPPPPHQAYPPFPRTYASPPAQAYPPPPPREYRTSQDFDPYKPRPYNPADHASPVTAAAAAGATAAQTSPLHQPGTSPSPPRQTANPYENYAADTRERRPSVAEIRYRPVNYTPSIPSGSASPRSAHGVSPASTYTPPHSAGLPPSNPYPAFAQPAHAPKVGRPMPPPMYRQTSYSQPPSRSTSQRGRQSARHRDRRTSVPRSFSSVREKLHNMNEDERKMAAGAIGAVAGGVLGHELAHNDVGTALGAAMGGLALRGWEKKKENARSGGLERFSGEANSKDRNISADHEAYGDKRQLSENQTHRDSIGYESV